MIEQLKTLREFVEAYSPSRNPSGAEALTALTQLEAMVGKREPVPECRYPDCECPAKSACLQDLPVLQTKAVPLQVLYYSMPTSCGKTNWTASLVTKGRGYFNLARSEYPQHVRYQADYVRWLIGELDMMPYLPDYNTHEQTPCHLCGGVGEVDGKPCKGLKFEGVIHNAAAGAALDDPKQPQAETDESIAADAYGMACDEMERWQHERRKAGKDAGTTGSLVDGIEWLYGYINDLEDKQTQAEAVPPDVVLDADVEAAAKKMAEIFDYPWDFMPEKGRNTMRENVRAVLDAAIAQQKGQP